MPAWNRLSDPVVARRAEKYQERRHPEPGFSRVKDLARSVEILAEGLSTAFLSPRARFFVA
jgi:hypothetical protein